ncbi:MAG TPA: sigma-70 family RNA polymerase sigma factor [Bradyrhizobium sp.]|nr:sigma-70 family RNA polymerase sigma factor [Bradyrhizobium sp.]
MTNVAALKQFLLLCYDDLKVRLTQRLGSAELAADALQDTWLRLDRDDAIAPVQRADAYLFRVAVNIARDHLRSEGRRLSTGEIAVLLNIADDAPGPLQTLEDRSDLAALKKIMTELPPRQRSILVAARLEGLSRQQIADCYGISVRMVQRELQEAQDYCAARLRRFGRNRFSLGRRETSLGGASGEAVLTERAQEPSPPDDET